MICMSKGISDLQSEKRLLQAACMPVYFPHQKETGVGGDLCSLKINLDGCFPSASHRLLTCGFPLINLCYDM